ncbi:O-methyltransferase [Aspergillus ellipticus CBS 707.79]|uniref:O-methyltransferase n=1 Tax=Aspergillus ellipticus CBS 707.79 TaxID=1448320 RepID=A0A319CVT5_9EURO|nr:O-methyltransferase [Aspergillus ellipticus CBS 707.79]
MAQYEPNIARIQQCLAEVTAAVDKYAAQPATGSQDARYHLMVQATRLVQTLRGPADLVFAHFENLVNIGAIRTLLEAGVFDAIPTGGGSISATEIASRTGVDKEIIAVRLMRALTPLGPFRETGEEEYAHRPESEIYLAPQMRAVFGLMIDEYSPAMLRTHEFLQQQNWQHNITLKSNPFSLVHNCEGQTMFEHISQFPARATRLNDAMVAEDSLLAEIGLYPFAKTLTPLAQPDTPTIVDVGGGRGHILKQLRQSLPNLPGRFILQDLASVIQDNGDMTTHGIEAMAHDFFAPQPVQGALIYFIRRVLHDWPDAEVVRILTHLARAMDREKSRILITETIIPEVKATPTNAYMDLTMMTFGGRERTVKHFAGLFERAGLTLEGVWRLEGVPMVVVAGKLK